MAKKDKITIRLPPPVNRLGEEFVTVFKKRRAGPTDTRRKRASDVRAGRSRKPRNAKEKAEENPWKESDVDKYSPCPRCGGEGKLPAFPHVQAGTCFRCQGSGLCAKDWRSSAPEQFSVLGAPVRVYAVKGDLRALVRQKDFDKYGTPLLALNHPLVSTFLRKRGSVYGAFSTKDGWVETPLVLPPTSSLLEAFPDYFETLYPDEIPPTPTARRRWEERKDLIRRASAKLARKITDALREHYKS